MQRLLVVHHRRVVSFAVTRNLGNLVDINQDVVADSCKTIRLKQLLEISQQLAAAELRPILEKHVTHRAFTGDVSDVFNAYLLYLAVRL